MVFFTFLLRIISESSLNTRDKSSLFIQLNYYKLISRNISFFIEPSHKVGKMSRIQEKSGIILRAKSGNVLN